MFAIAAVFVWLGGSSLSRYADAIAERTGLGHGFVGVLFLGAATSLPELAPTTSAVTEGYPTLAGLFLSFALSAAVVFVSGFGIDSAVVLVLYTGGMVLLYAMH